MKTAELSPLRLDELLGCFPQARIAVLGDFFLDKYLHVDPALEELSLETGKAARQVVDVSTSPGAAGTVAKSMSAYDMAVSDAIYGNAERYVSQDRLLHMLDHEYDLLHERRSRRLHPPHIDVLQKFCHSGLRQCLRRCNELPELWVWVLWSYQSPQPNNPYE